MFLFIQLNKRLFIYSLICTTNGNILKFNLFSMFCSWQIYTCISVLFTLSIKLIAKICMVVFCIEIYSNYLNYFTFYIRLKYLHYIHSNVYRKPETCIHFTTNGIYNPFYVDSPKNKCRNVAVMKGYITRLRK